MTTQEIETVRDTIGRLAKVWPPLRGDRLTEYLEAVQRQDLDPIDIRAGFALLVDAYREAYPPNPADLVAFAHLAREQRQDGERQAELDARANAGWITRLGAGCPTCRHEGYGLEECVRKGRWVGGGHVVHCIHHNMGWPGQMPPDPDPGDTGYIRPDVIRDFFEKLAADASMRRATSPRTLPPDAPRELVQEVRAELLAEARARHGTRTPPAEPIADPDPEPVGATAETDPWA